MDGFDQDCAKTFARIASGQMPLTDFICWVADNCAVAYAQGRGSAFGAEADKGASAYSELELSATIAQLRANQLESREA